MHIDKLVRRKGSVIIEKNRVLGGHTRHGLFIKDSSSGCPPWNTLSIQLSDLTFSRTPYLNGVEHIAYETEPKRLTAWRVLQMRLREARLTRRTLKSLVGRAAFNRIVQFHTRGTKWIRGHLIGFRKNTKLMTTNTLTPLYKEHELSKKQFLEKLVDPVATPGLPSRLRRQAQESLDNIASHPEWDDTFYYLWLEVVGWSASSPINSHLFADLEPIFDRRLIPLRDWVRIRKAWLRLRQQVQVRVDANEEHILRLQKEADRLSFRHTSKWNQMWQVGDHADLPSMTGTMPSMEARTFIPYSGIFLSTKGNSPLMTFAYSSTDWSTARSGFSSQHLLKPGLTAEELGAIVKSFETVPAVSDLSFCWTSMPERLLQYAHIMSDEEDEQIIAAYTEGDLFTTRVGVDSFRSDSGTLPTPTLIDLDKVDGVDPEVEFFENRLLKVKQLLALDIGAHSDNLNFNFARSVGELKDSKDTLRSGMDFIRWANALRHGTPYYEVHMEKGKGPIRYFMPGSRDSTSILVASVHSGTKGSNVLRSRSLRKAGILKVFVRRITPLTAAAQLASLYLSWKFGISQTLADTNTVLMHGWKWATTVRRGLHQLALHLDAAREYHTLRRMWRYRSPKLPRIVKVDSYTESDLPASPDTVTLDDQLDFIPAYRVLNGDREGRVHIPGHPTWFIVESRLGFWFMDPVMRITDDTHDVYGYNKAIQKHNDDLLSSLLSERGLSGRIFIRNDMRGVVFAKYSWKAILRGLRRGLSNLHASLKTFSTAWELTPLSFVVEWFLNVRKLVDSAQALVERAELKILPVGRPWEMLSSTLWVGALPSGVTGTVDWCVDGVGTALVQFPGASGSLAFRRTCVTTVVTHVTLNYTFRRTTQDSVVMRRSSIRRAVRRPFAGDYDELPPVRVKLNLNTGKLGSLLAILVSKLK